MKNQIIALHAAIKQNGGMIPAELIPYAELLKALLRVAKIFCNDDIDKIIDEIIAAIDLLEQS